VSELERAKLNLMERARAEGRITTHEAPRPKVPGQHTNGFHKGHTKLSGWGRRARMMLYTCASCSGPYAKPGKCGRPLCGACRERGRKR